MRVFNRLFCKRTCVRWMKGRACVFAFAATVLFVDNSTITLAQAPNAPTFSIFGLQFSPDGKYLAATSNSLEPPGPVVMWNVPDWSTAIVHRPATGGLDVDFSPSGDRMAYGTKRGKLGILEIPSGRLLLEFEADATAVNTVAFSPDGKTLFTGGGDRQVHMWNAETGKATGTFVGHSDGVFGVAISPDGATLASGAGDNETRLWDVATKKERRKFGPYGSIVRRVCFTRDGQYFLSSSYDGKTRIRDAKSGELLAQLDSGNDCADITQDNGLVATSGYGSTAHVYRLDLRDATPEERAKFEELIGQFQNDGYAVRERADRQIAEMGMVVEPLLQEAMKSDDAEVRVRSRYLRDRVLSPKPIAELGGHAGDVEVVAFSPDGKLLATACRGGDIKIWETSEFREVVTLRMADIGVR